MPTDTAVIKADSTTTTTDAPASVKQGDSADESSADGGEYIINPATGNRVRRNYKNMTSERRKEANARERSRVHVIAAAFERLRTQVPLVVAEQKLSKLSVLRIACKYILLLGAMNDMDFSHDQQRYSVDECVNMLNDTIAAESKYAAGGIRAGGQAETEQQGDEDEDDGDEPKEDELVTVD